jgi:hypothetical protein
MPKRGKSQKAKVKSKVYCVACKKPIQGKPSVMRLQITHKNPRMIECAKKVGFTSPNWDLEEEMQGAMHRQCFNQAMLIWEIAFHTRALSPRRHPGEPPHPPHLE